MFSGGIERISIFIHLQQCLFLIAAKFKHFQTHKLAVSMKSWVFLQVSKFHDLYEHLWFGSACLCPSLIEKMLLQFRRW